MAKSQHQAIKKSLEYINKDHEWVVDMDLKKCNFLKIILTLGVPSVTI